MNIIGISGPAGSGKDTFADMLLENDGFVRLSLADPIKRFAMDVWEFSETQLWGPSEHRSIPDTRYEICKSPNYIEYLTPRKVLQHLGTEGCRSVDEDVWIRYALRIANFLLENPSFTYSYSRGVYPSKIKNYPATKVVILPDIRFCNEINRIKKAGGTLIRIIRPGSGLTGEYAQHQSESEMSSISSEEFDFIINNDGSLDDLRKQANYIVTNLKYT